MATDNEDHRAEALAALVQVRDQLTVALDLLTRLDDQQAAGKQVGKASDRLGTAKFHLRRLMRDRVHPDEYAQPRW